MEYTALLQEANDLMPQLIAHRHYLHAHAEVGFDLNDTLPYVKQALLDMGCEPKECGRSGLSVTLGGKKPGKVFLLRADMDALPIQEESGVDFSSENGQMHACGHDLHTTMLLGAARLLKAHEDEICGTVKLMFQPAEEPLGGAIDMLDHGILKNPDVDAAMMIHVMTGCPFPEGTVTIAPAGVSAPAADIFEIHIQGKGCHGSSPNTGIDPLNVAAHILINLQALHARELAMDDRAALTIGSVHGGIAPNVIPDTVKMGGTLRSFHDETRTRLKERIVQIAEGTAAMFGAQAQVNFLCGCPTLYNDPALCQDAARYLADLLGENKAFPAEKLAQMAAEAIARSGELAESNKRTISVSGSEDFAFIAERVPAIMLSLAAGHPANGHKYTLHHPQATFSDDVLSVGSAVHACMAIRWLEEHSA